VRRVDRDRRNDYRQFDTHTDDVSSNHDDRNFVPFTITVLFGYYGNITDRGGDTLTDCEPHSYANPNSDLDADPNRNGE